MSLPNRSASLVDHQHLIAHLGRKTLQGSPTRDFKAAWHKDKNGHIVPKI